MKRHMEYTGEDIKKYLDEHFQESIKIGKIAKEFSTLSKHISRVFKAEYNKTVTDYLQELRLEHVKKMLIETQDNVGDIAKESGFRTISHLNKQFKLNTDMTPGEYRAVSRRKCG